MTSRPIQNNISSEMASHVVKPNIASRNIEVPTKLNAISSNSPSISSMSSRYTYALGEDGRRYVLQLRITLAGSGFSAFA